MGSKPEVEYFNLQRISSTLEYRKKNAIFGEKVILVNKIDPDVKIKANGTLISWAVENLIRNGIDAINKGNGKIEVALNQDVHYIKIHITDNGCVSPKKIGRIFLDQDLLQRILDGV